MTRFDDNHAATIEHYARRAAAELVPGIDHALSFNASAFDGAARLRVHIGNGIEPRTSSYRVDRLISIDAFRYAADPYTIVRCEVETAVEQMRAAVPDLFERLARRMAEVTQQAIETAGAAARAERAAKERAEGIFAAAVVVPLAEAIARFAVTP